MTGQALALALPLCLVILALVVAILYVEREHRKERQADKEAFAAERERLIEVALAPGAVATAAYTAALPTTAPPPQDEYDEAIRPSADFLTSDLMEVE